MSFRLVSVVILILSSVYLWQQPARAQDSGESPSETQATVAAPITLEFVLGEDADISESLTVTLAISVTPSITSGLTLLELSAIPLQIEPFVVDASPGVTVLVDVPLSVTVAIEAPEDEAPEVSPETVAIIGVVNRNANARLGPGTGFSVSGQYQSGEEVTIVGRNDAGDWFLLDDGTWIAAFLVDTLSEDISRLSDAQGEPEKPGTIPPGWTRYTLLANDVEFAVPPGWTAEAETAAGTRFVPSDGSIKGLHAGFIEGVAQPGMDDKELIRALKLLVVESLDNLNVAFVQEGTLNIDGKPLYVVGKVSFPDEDGSGAFVAVLTSHAKGTILVLYWTFGTDTISDDTMAMLTLLANSFVLSADEVLSEDGELDATAQVTTSDDTHLQSADQRGSDSPAVPNSNMVGNARIQLPDPSELDFDVIPIGRSDNIVYIFIRNNTSEVYQRLSVDVVARDVDGTMLAVDDAIGSDPRRVGPGEVAFNTIYFSDVTLPADVQFEFDVSARPVSANEETGDLVIEEHNRIENRFVGMIGNPGTGMVSGPIEVQVLCFDEDGEYLRRYSDYTTKDEVAPGAAIPFQVDMREACTQYLMFASGFTR